MAKKKSPLMKSKVFYPASRKEPVFFVKYRKLFFLCLGVLGIGMGGVYGISKLLEKAPLWVENFSKKAGFIVEDIVVEGRQTTSRSDLLQALEMKRGDCLFSFSPQVLKKKLEELPWIRSAIIRRQLPNTFYIHLAEKKPLALWQVKGEIKLLDQEGQVIPCASKEAQEGLILVVGEKASQHVGALLETLEKTPAIKKRVLAAVYLRSGRWNLHLDNKWVLKLPENHVERALHHFLSFENQHQFLNNKVAAVDLRTPGAFVIRLTPEAAAEGRARKLRTSVAGKEA